MSAVGRGAVTPPPTSAVGAPAPATTIDEVVERMSAIDSSLPEDDGVACFNRLYLNVTREIRGSDGATAFEDLPFLDALDVSFANFYFEAFHRVKAGEPCPPPWAPLFDNRERAHTSRLQFALVGMNAHINHDLPLAVVRTASEAGIEPFGDSPYERDFFRVNDLLAAVEGKIKTWFATGVIAELDHYLSGIDDALSMWCIHGARRAAWDSAAMLWRLKAHRHLVGDYEAVLANLVNLAGRAVLV
jgi:hypothetical protein